MVQWQSVVTHPAPSPAPASEVPAEVEKRMRDRRWRFSDYVVVRLAGEGPLARVFRAWNVGARRFVALKLVRAERTTKEVEGRFFEVVRDAARVRHPAAGRVYRAGKHSGALYLEAEWIDGPTLAQRQEWPVEVARAVASDVVRALAAAHVDGVSHGALGPSNVFVADGRGKVADFGMGRARDGQPGEPMDDVRSAGTMIAALIGARDAAFAALAGKAQAGELSSAALLAAVEGRAAT